MDIIKTILKNSFFSLGCIMLFLALLVIPIGLKSFLWFFTFAAIFYLFSFSYLKKIFLYLMPKIKSIILKSNKDEFKTLNNLGIRYNDKIVYLNSKSYSFNQLVSVTIKCNNKKIDKKELKHIEKINKLELVVGTKIKKLTYRSFKYDSKNKLNQEKKNIIKDYKIMNKLIEHK